ncbi:(2Fe-2S)-binding protein [Gracilaria domingensis]|nr:(2Fe-2S)-binding protein [Gracilaria domingensis]
MTVGRLCHKQRLEHNGMRRLIASNGEGTRWYGAFTSNVPCWGFKRRVEHIRAMACEADKTVVVTYRGRKIAVQRGEKLRTTLIRNGSHPHNGGLVVTCRGLGTCGTCAVSVVSGTVEPPTISWREKARLSFPPHSMLNTTERRLRLACQIRAGDSDVTLEKYAGFWGHKATMLDELED